MTFNSFAYSSDKAAITVPVSLLLQDYTSAGGMGRNKNALHRAGVGFLSDIGRRLGLHFTTQSVRGPALHSGSVTLSSYELQLRLYEPPTCTGLLLCAKGATQGLAQAIPLCLLADDDEIFSWLGQMKYLVRQARKTPCCEGQTVRAKLDDEPSGRSNGARGATQHGDRAVSKRLAPAQPAAGRVPNSSAAASGAIH